MKRNKILNSFLLLVVSFFLFTVYAKAVETQEAAHAIEIGTNESVDVFSKIGRSGKIAKISDVTSDVLDMSGCKVGGTSCIVKLKNTTGLWYPSGHFFLQLEGKTPEYIQFDIKNKWPAIVSLGDYNDFSYKSSEWGKLSLALANGKAIESRTREKINLPTFKGADKNNLYAKNGLPIKFVGFLKIVYEDQSNAGTTFVITLPVQRPGMCSKGGNVDEPGDMGTFINEGAEIDGTGPYVYVSCYEYRDFVRLDLGGGEPKSGKLAGWEYDEVTKTYISKQSGVKLPTDAEIRFPFGLVAVKHVAAWTNQDYEMKNPGATVDLNGDTWSPVFDANVDPDLLHDREIRVNEVSTISNSGSDVVSCSAESNEYLKVNGVKDKKCEVEGLKKSGDNVVVVTVKYSNGETIDYNVKVVACESCASEDAVFDVNIDVVDIQDEDAGQGDIAFRTCKSYTTSTAAGYGSVGKIRGTDLHISVYTASGCGVNGMVGMCVDPSAPGPGHAKYIRDTAWNDIATDPKWIAVVSALSADINTYTCTTTKLKSNDQSQKCVQIRSAAQITFRLISVKIGRAWNYAGADAYDIFLNASKELNLNKASTVKNALAEIFNHGHSSGAAQATYSFAKKYLEAFANGTTAEVGPKDFKLTKKLDKYEKTGSNSYNLYISGKLTTPAGIGIDVKQTYKTDSAFLSKWGYSIESLTFKYVKKGDYSYTAKIVIPNADPKVLKVPTSKKEKKNASISIPISGKYIRDIYVIRPASGEHRQRLLFFDEGTKSVRLFFGPDDMDVPPEGFCNGLNATMLENCEEEAKNAKYEGSGGEGTVSNEGATTCNFKLVRHCCGLVDEGTYPNTFYNVCSNSCSYNSLGSVCAFIDYGAGSEGATLYHVREGYKLSRGADGKINFTKSLGNCTVNLDDFRTVEDFDDDDDKEDYISSFDKVDAAGNSINVSAYKNNPYCKVTCREEWDMTLGAFGSYMGLEAVRAGASFQIDKADLFIRGDRYCYTSYLNDKQYVKDMNKYSDNTKGKFDEYSKYAHAYTDLTGASYSLPLANSVSSTSGTGGTSEGELNGHQACKQWNKVYFRKMTEAKKTYKCPEGYSHTTNKYSDSCRVAVDADSSHCTPTVQDGYWVNSSGTCRTYSYETGSFDKYVFTYDSPGEDMGLECTSKTERKPICDDQTGTCDDSNKDTKFKDNAVDITFYGSFKISGLYNSGCGAGNYKTADGCGGAYPRYNSSATCKIIPHVEDKKIDEVECSYGGSGKTKYKANVSGLIDKINTLSIGTTSLSGTISGGYVKRWYNSTAGDLERLIEKAKDEFAFETQNLTMAANAWYDCNNFIVYTNNYTGTNLNELGDTIDVSKYGLDPHFTALGSKRTPVLISTSFNPKVSYFYDQNSYMQQLQIEDQVNGDKLPGNILVRNDAKNSSYVTGIPEGDTNDPSKLKSFFDPAHPTVNVGKSYDVKLKLNAAEMAANKENLPQQENNILAISKKESKFYTASKPWTPDSTAGKNYDNGAGKTSVTASVIGTVRLCTLGTYNPSWGETEPYNSIGNAGNTWTGGGCYPISLYGYKDVNYIERSVINSSFFKNRGNWFANVNSVTVHGDNIADGIKAYNKFFKTELSTQPKIQERWHVLGAKNVFPVSATTPRNLYKYTYVFSNIGSYYDNSVGRLMGNANSTFKSNSRTCFYEVIEALCKCCGDTSVNYVVDVEGINNNVTTEFAKKNEKKLGKVLSSDNDIKSSNQGQLGFYNTVSSLTNLSALSDTSGDRQLAANWTNQALFNYNGYNRYVTNKGDVALKAIEAVGEDIYSPKYKAEYAYRLTPQAISDIKQDNKKSNYGASFDAEHMKLYGKVKVDSNGSETPAKSGSADAKALANEISFEHYGSVFLEEFASKYAKGKSDDGTFDNLDLASKNEVCVINEKAEVNGKNGAALADLIKSKMDSGCRWVDYIENYGKPNQNYMASYYQNAEECKNISDDALRKSCEVDSRVKSSFRLAFK